MLVGFLGESLDIKTAFSLLCSQFGTFRLGFLCTGRHRLALIQSVFYHIL